MSIYNKKVVNGRLILFLIALMILTLIVSYLIEPGSNYNSYSYLVAFLALYFCRPLSKISFYLLMIIVIYSLGYDNEYLSSRLGYMLTFSLTCLSLYTLPLLKLTNFDDRKIQRFVTVLCYSIIVFYYLTSVTTENIDSTRSYTTGFIIPHQFAYFMAIFAYYMLKKRKYYLSIIPIIYTFYVGTRTGLILMVFVIMAHIYTLLKSVNIKSFGRAMLFVGISSAVILSFENPVRNQVTSTYDLLNMSALLSDSRSQDATEFTSNRNFLAIIGFEKIASDGVSTFNIFGRGPRSSYSFIEEMLNWRIWFHNDLLEIAFSLGFIHLFLYVYCVYNYAKQTRSYFFLYFVLIAALTNGFFLYTSFVLIGVHYLASYEPHQLTN